MQQLKKYLKYRMMEVHFSTCDPNVNDNQQYFMKRKVEVVIEYELYKVMECNPFSQGKLQTRIGKGT